MLQLVVIVELLLKIVLIYVCYTLELQDLDIVYPLEVYPLGLFYNLSELKLIVQVLYILITTTSANISLSILVSLLSYRFQVFMLVYVLCELVYRVTHLLQIEVAFIDVVVRSILTNVSFIDSILELKDFVLQLQGLPSQLANSHLISINKSILLGYFLLQILEPFLRRSESFYYIVGAKLVLLRDISQSCSKLITLPISFRAIGLGFLQLPFGSLQSVLEFGLTLPSRKYIFLDRLLVVHQPIDHTLVRFNVFRLFLNDRFELISF